MYLPQYKKHSGYAPAYMYLFLLSFTWFFFLSWYVVYYKCKLAGFESMTLGGFLTLTSREE